MMSINLSIQKKRIRSLHRQIRRAFNSSIDFDYYEITIFLCY